MYCLCILSQLRLISTNTQKTKNIEGTSPWAWCSILSSLLHIVRKWSCYLAHTMKFFMSWNRFCNHLLSIIDKVTENNMRHEQLHHLSVHAVRWDMQWQTAEVLLGQAEWGKHPSFHNARKKAIPLKITPWTWCSHWSFICFIGCRSFIISDKYCIKLFGKNLNQV